MFQMCSEKKDVSGVSPGDWGLTSQRTWQFGEPTSHGPPVETDMWQYSCTVVIQFHFSLLLHGKVMIFSSALSKKEGNLKKQELGWHVHEIFLGGIPALLSFSF